MYRNIKINALTLTLFTIFSCSEEQSDYDYIDINEISFGGIEKEYSGLLGQPFEIKPTLHLSKDNIADTITYEYEWIAMKQGAVAEEDRQKNLGNTKNLQLEALTIPPATYDVFYRVTDMKTNVQWSTSFVLHVESSIYQGWLVLSDVNGSARLDMISKVAGEDLLLYDVLESSGSSLKLEGAPINVYCYNYDSSFYGIYVTAELTGTTKIHPETFDWEQQYNLSYEMFSKVETNFAADFIQRIAVKESLMYKDENFYYYFNFNSSSIRYGVPINIVEGDTHTFRAAPFAAPGTFLGTNLLYDMDNKRFVRHSTGSQHCNILPEGTLFDFNTGKDLLYMVANNHDWSGAKIYAILHDPSDNKLFLARMKTNGGAITQEYYQEIPSSIAMDMAQADHFAVNPQFGYIFYNVGSRIYQYDLGLKQTKLMLDKGTDKITVLKFQDMSNIYTEPNATYRNQLTVASYNEGSANGTLELYTVPPVNGELILTTSYDGFGDIVSIAYRER